MTTGATVRDVPVRIYVKKLANYIRQNNLFKIPSQYSENEKFSSLFIEQAACVLQQLYLHPYNPLIMLKCSTSTEKLCLPNKCIHFLCFEQFLSLKWVQKDKSGLFIITKEMKSKMDEIAAFLVSSLTNEPNQI